MVNRPANGKASMSKGESRVLFAGGALLLVIGLVVAIVALLFVNGLSGFWPSDLWRITDKDGNTIVGMKWRSEEVPRPSDQRDAPARQRTLYRIGPTRELGADFTWIDDDAVVEATRPADATIIERTEWGAAIGVAKPGAPDVLVLGNGKEVVIDPATVVRRVRPNELGVFGKLGVYFGRIAEFVSAPPRESNTEGGILPAIMGTVLLVLLMTMAVVPLGVIAALYLNEYARQGVLLRFVRLAVSNLAGVPSIVFGMFGLAFFVYTLGAGIDQLLFSDRLPSPTFGTGGLLWASLTLALLTVPVVIVATEEALRAVPRAQREGSLALGATRWQTIRTVVLPASLPGILTGMILAIARGAGEVAPLMLTGVMKLASDPLVDGNAPFIHLDRKFMHMGFHVFDVGYQSPNVEASRPLVYATALLLLLLIVALNLSAIVYRNRVRRRLSGATF